MKITEIDYTTDPATVTERDLTAAELAQLKADKDLESQRQKEIEDNAAIKTALLDRLGITAEEAKILIS